VTLSSSPLLERIKELEREGLAAIKEAVDLDALEQSRVRFLGRRGPLASVMGSISSAPPPERPLVGKAANAAKKALAEAMEARKAELAPKRRRLASVDGTLPGRKLWAGGIHPITQVMDEICGIFSELGFTRARGPEVESVHYNFTALNIPLDHPAADMMDTFYLEDGVVLRTHTSPVQARVMEAHKPPIRVVVPGLAYRRDSFDPGHAPCFEQIEGLAVDEGVDFVEFRAAIHHFVNAFFGPSVECRFRPSFYPFTEPSAEVDVTCTVCAGSGCPTCKRTGWVTIMGSGMVDPAVFEQVGYDPERWTGYAFGMGPARIAMVRHGIPDMRLLYEADVEFLGQFA